MSVLELVEYSKHNDGGDDVRQLEEHKVSCLTVVNKVQVACDKDQEVQDLCAFGDPLTRLPLQQDGEQNKNTEKVQVVTYVPVNIPRMARELCHVCGPCFHIRDKSWVLRRGSLC